MLPSLRFAARFLKNDTIFLHGKYTMLPSVTLNNMRDIHITSKVTKEFRVGTGKVRAAPKGKDVIMDGETNIEVTNALQMSSLFPDANTPQQIFGGVPYNQLHIINIKSTPNNTIMSLTDCTGLLISLHSAGCEGFKNTKKGTNIAAQQTAVTFATRVLDHGVGTVRLRVQGIGPGRMGAIKGLQLMGLNVVSITDDTRVSWNPPRPRKQRRI